MPLPIYVITGSLDVGKTTFINNILDKRKVRALVDRQLITRQNFKDIYDSNL